jgi:phospho-N-acetylmuramoyl-pentapeptide-transferase
MLSINHHHHLSRIRLSRPPKPFSSSPLYSNSFHNFKVSFFLLFFHLFIFNFSKK